jgi:hypothetical protein
MAQTDFRDGASISVDASVVAASLSTAASFALEPLSAGV